MIRNIFKQQVSVSTFLFIVSKKRLIRFLLSPVFFVFNNSEIIIVMAFLSNSEYYEMMR